MQRAKSAEWNWKPKSKLWGRKRDVFSGERTRLACWRWRPRHRELFPAAKIVSACRRNQHASRVRSPEKMCTPTKVPRTIMNPLPKKIAVLMGGPGSERDVSIATGTGAAKALRSLGIDVVEIDVKSPDFELPADIELAFLTIHGTFGEDGQLQRILEERGIASAGAA